MHCLGRHVSDTSGRLQFCDGTYFHIELRCPATTDAGELCLKCLEKERRTRERAEGTRLKGVASSVLHGKITDPIPLWSHIFEGEWYEKQLKKGRTLSEETMARAKKAKEAASGQAVIDKFFVEGHDPLPVVPVIAKPAAPAASIITKQPARKKKTIQLPPPAPPVARLKSAEPVEPDEVIEIAIRSFEHAGTSYYIASSSNKVYTKQLKYMGRWNAKSESIDPYPDSDVSQ